MKKDSYYFPHYINARNDRKIKRVIKELGIEGYAIYFMLLEILREQLDFRYPVDDIDLIADELNVSEQKVRVVICNYDLFQIDDQNNFLSMKQIYYLQPYIEKTNNARAAANLRWSKVKGESINDANAYANALPEHCDSNADAMQGKERKGKESKISKVFNAPHLDEVIEFIENNFSFDSEKTKLLSNAYYDYYTSNGWKVGKNAMKDWKAALRNWIRNDKNFKHGTTKQTAASWSEQAREWAKPFGNQTLEEIFGNR